MCSLSRRRFFALPLAIAPAVPLYDFFLMSFPMLIGPAALFFLISLMSWSCIPFRLSSDPARTPSKPIAFYLIEDVGAVDFGNGKEWRRSMRQRYVETAARCMARD